MISSQRQHLILSRLRTRGAVRITALSKELGVSAMTIRRDIADLADKGLLKRVHGGAVSTSTLLSEPLFSVKSQMDIGLKDAIAQEAVKYVAPGDVIAIGGGTTAYVFAQHLLESQQSSGITILTNSIPVAELVQALESKDVEVIVTGGVTTRSNSLVGPIADKVVASLRVNTVFLGTHSVSIPRGFLMPQIRRNNDLCCLAVSRFRKCLQTLQCQHCLICTGFLDILDTFRSRFLHSTDGFCLTFCLFDPLLLFSFRFQDRCLLGCLCLQNHRLFLTFCYKDRRFLFTFRTEDCFSSFTLRLHLLLHGILNCFRRHNIFQLYTVYFNSPFICRNIQDRTHLGVDRLTGSQCLIQFQITDNITQRCCCQIFDRRNRAFYPVCILLRVSDLIEYDGINLHRNIIFCNYCLRFKVNDLFFQ